MSGEVTSTIWAVADAVTTYLQNIMEDAISEDDDTRAGLVRIGRLQQSPLTAGINILTDFNDIDNPDGWLHEVVSSSSSSLGLDVGKYPYEMGGNGGEIWWRRYTSELTLFAKKSADRARMEFLAQTILRRAEYGIKTSPLPQSPDVFGETAIRCYVAKSRNIEGGGQGQFIFRGKIWWQCLTEIE